MANNFDDDNLDFSLDPFTLDDPMAGDFKTEKKTLDDIEEVVFDDGNIDVVTKKKSLDDIEDVDFEEVVITTDRKSAMLDDVEEAAFAEVVITETKKSTLDDIAEPTLAVDEAPKTEYKQTYVDPSLEEAKKSAKANANKAALASDTRTSQQKLDSMREFQREQIREKAKKGGRQVFMLMILGIIANVLFYIYSTETLSAFKEDATFSLKVAPFIPYGCIAGGLFSFLILIPQKTIKGFATFIFFILSAAALFLGGPMLMGKENIGISLAQLVPSAAIFIINFVTLAGSENIEAFVKKKDRY